MPEVDTTACPLFPVRERTPRGAGLDEVLHLHLLELASAEDEVPDGDLVAEALADLRDAERELLADRLDGRNSTNIPCAVSGRRYAMSSSPAAGPCRWNIRLKSFGSVNAVDRTVRTRDRAVLARLEMVLRGSGCGPLVHSTSGLENPPT